MAITYSNLAPPTPAGGGKRVVRGILAFDSSYPTGGELIESAKFGLKTIESFEIKGEELGYAFEYVPTTKKLKVYFGGSSAHNHDATGLNSAGESAGTPAGMNSAPAFTGTPDTITPSLSADSAGTPAGTLDSISGGTPEGTNASSNVMAQKLSYDINGFNVPTFALVHSADPEVLLNATPLYCDIFASPYLNSNQNATASTAFVSQDNGGIYTSVMRAWGWVKHQVAPSGVQIFVDEADGDKLKANFTGVGSAGDKVVPMKLDGGVLYLKIIDANTAGMKALYYDDNGADNAKLVFVDTGNVGGSINALNLEKGLYASGTLDGKVGMAQPQTFTGVALAGHAHTFSGGALGAHGHTVTGASYTPVGTVEAPTFNGVTLGNHWHAIGGSTAGASAGSAGEVTNGTNLVVVGLIACEFEAVGS